MSSIDALRRTFVLANPFKEGDLPVGGTRDDALRHDARRELLACRVGDIRRAAFVDDGVTEALERGRDRTKDSDLDSLTIAHLKAAVLAAGGPAWVHQYCDALRSEVIAAIAKVMDDEQLGAVSRRLFNPLPDGIGAPGHFGSRVQPNSAGDDEEEILFSILDGLSRGCGDVVIGLNPAADETETIVRLEQLLERVVRRLDLPTRFCVLSDIIKQREAQTRTRVEVGFQSLAGSSKALTGMVGLDVDGLLDIVQSFDGLYFETGQGSAVSNGVAEGVDMVTLEARAYGVARYIQRKTGRWMIVNDVAGFIGPEVFRSPAQLERACLEDLFMARLHGLTMGLDVCATFHMGIPPAELRALTARVVKRGAPAYLMAVAGNADPMLGYLTTSFADHHDLRRSNGTRITAAMERRVAEGGWSAGLDGVERVAHLYAQYLRAGGDTRGISALHAEGRTKIGSIQERGLDIAGDVRASHARVDTIYQHARAALYAELQEAVLRDACDRHIGVRTHAVDRDDYIAHPASGERLRAEDLAALAKRRTRSPAIQLVVSDGLNADAINEQLRALLPPVRRLLTTAGHAIAQDVVVIRNGRVRAGYHAAQALDPDVLIHVIGERPGTGLNTASAYLTFGRDAAGQPRWHPQLDHSCTTAVCGIHRKGKTPEAAAAEIARTVQRMIEQRRSGVALR